MALSSRQPTKTADIAERSMSFTALDFTVADAVIFSRIVVANSYTYVSFGVFAYY